jgi:UDP-2,3-diacylglucosamine pyrophosphatase LpxH
MPSDNAKFFISDLHLGDGSRADDFHQTEAFLKFIDRIAPNCERLIIVGDLLELWQSDLDRIVFYHDKIIKRLLALAKEGRLTYLVGNHDYMPFTKYIDESLQIQLNYQDKAIGLWAEHGNQYDIFNRYKYPGMAISIKYGRHISHVIGWLERLLHPDIDEWANKIFTEKRDIFLQRAAAIKNMLPPSSKDYYKRGGDLSEYEKAASRLIKEGKKIVIFGHTHKPLLKRINSGIYTNCGCWTGKAQPTYIRLTPASIDLINGISDDLIDTIEI